MRTISSSVITNRCLHQKMTSGREHQREWLTASQHAPHGPHVGALQQAMAADLIPQAALDVHRVPRPALQRAWVLVSVQPELPLVLPVPVCVLHVGQGHPLH